MASFWMPLSLTVLGLLAVAAGVPARLWWHRAPRLLCVGLGAQCLIAGVVWVVVVAGQPAPPTGEPVAVAVTMEDMQRKLVVGSPAPDFTLPAVDGDGPVHLAELIGPRPVVLVLGSFRCSYFCTRLDAVQGLYERFKPRAEFLFVYIDNEHYGLEEDWLKAVVTDPTAPVDAPVNRLPRIRAGVRHYHLSMPCLDDFDEKQAVAAYLASPAKLVIIDQSGRVAFDSGSVTNSGLSPEKAAEWLELHTSAGVSSGHPDDGTRTTP